MAMRIYGGGRFKASNAQARDVDLAFDDDKARGEFVILESGDDEFIQAAGEDEGPYVVEYCEKGEQFRAEGEFTKEQVRAAFLSYVNGDNEWRSAHRWVPTDVSAGSAKAGCLGVLMIVLLPGLGLLF